MKENLGKTAKDKITGFTGKIIAFVTYSEDRGDADQYGFDVPVKNEDMSIQHINTIWFSCGRMEIQ